MKILRFTSLILIILLALTSCAPAATLPPAAPATTTPSETPTTPPTATATEAPLPTAPATANTPTPEPAPLEALPGGLLRFPAPPYHLGNDPLKSFPAASCGVGESEPTVTIGGKVYSLLLPLDCPLAVPGDRTRTADVSAVFDSMAILPELTPEEQAALADALAAHGLPGETRAARGCVPFNQGWLCELGAGVSLLAGLEANGNPALLAVTIDAGAPLGVVVAPSATGEAGESGGDGPIEREATDEGDGCGESPSGCDEED